MDLTSSQVEEIEGLIAQLESVDPADLPEPAAALVEMLNQILEEDSEG